MSTITKKSKRIPTDLNFRSGTLEVLAADAGQEPGPSKLKLIAYTGGPMDLSGFYYPVVVDLSGAKFAKAGTPIIADHDPAQRVGHSLEQAIIPAGRSQRVAGVAARGPLITAVAAVSSKSEAAKGIVSDSQSGFPFEVSIGARILKSFVVDKGDSVVVNGQTHKGPLIVAQQTVIREMSILTLGADQNTSAIAATQKGIEMSRANPNTTIDDEREQIAAEEERVDLIRAAFRKYDGVDEVTLEDGKTTIKASSLKRKAIQRGWTPDQVELLLLRAERPKPGVGERVMVPDHNFSSNGLKDMIGAVLMQRSGHGAIAAKAYPAHVLEAANPYRNCSLVDLTRLALSAEGAIVPHSTGEIIKAAFSTNTMIDALTGGIDKIAGMLMQESPKTWASFAAIKDLKNFRTHKVINPQHSGQLEEVGSAGEVKHGSIGDESFDLKLGTYSKQLRLTRQDLINDDLQLLNDLSNVFVIQAMRKVNDIVWGAVMDAGAFFSVGNANLITDALDLTALGAAVTAMRKQRDAEGNDLDIKPVVLAVPPELEAVGRQLLNSTLVNRAVDHAQDNLGTPTGNPLASITALEVESRLSNTGKFTNASTTAWYLFGGPGSSPVVVGFLNGQMTPAVEYFGLDSDINTLGVGWRVTIDVGAGPGEKRAAVKSTGVS